MATIVAAEPRTSFETGNLESSQPGISWRPIIGGAIAAISATLVFVSFGSALGFASISPWSNNSASLTALTTGAAIWLVVTQWLSSAFGGYLSGRLRTKWAVSNSDEVFFRDTAHGFLSWALATILVVWVVMSAVGGGANLAATVGAGVAQGAGDAAQGPMAYSVDSLFRPAAPASQAPAPAAPAPATGSTPADANATRGEAARILARGVSGELAPADRTYVAQLVAARTGLSQADAEKRVDDVVTAAKQDADAARKAAAAFGFFTALSLLVGAFVAAAAGALGGRHRDEL